MENTDELSKLLLEITQKLVKANKISESRYQELVANLSSKNNIPLYQIACELLKRTLYGNYYRHVKKEFENIYNLALKDVIIKPEDEKQLSYLKKRLCFSDLKFPIIFDGSFAFDIPINRLKIYAPIDFLDNVMLELYSMHADLETNIKKHDLDPERAIFYDVLTLDVYPYRINKSNNLTTTEHYIESNNEFYLTSEIDHTVLDLCFKDYERNIKIETAEYTFMNSIDGTSSTDFIKAMYLKDKVNFKKIDQISLKIYHDILEEEKKNGLQKTS